MTFGADFADIFEVRGMHRQKKGQRLEAQVEKDLVLLSYEGLDNTISQTRIRLIRPPNTIWRRNCSSKYISSRDRKQSYFSHFLQLPCHPRFNWLLRRDSFCRGEHGSLKLFR